MSGPPDWNARYAAAESSLYGDEPNDYVRMMLARADFRPATALVLADGDGRNGAWLAGRGIAVTALDISPVATDKALARDRARGVTAERITADLALWSPADGRQWDAAFIVYLQCDAEVRARAIRLAIAALAPGGWLVIEGFAKSRPGRSGLGPSRPEVRYDLGELEALAAGMMVIEALEGRVRLNEGAMHRGEAKVVRFAARRA